MQRLRRRGNTKNSIVLTLAALIAAISVVPAAHATDTIYNPIVNQNFSNNCANWSRIASAPYTSATCVADTSFPSGYAFRASFSQLPPANPGTLYSFAQQGYLQPYPGWGIPAVIDGGTTCTGSTCSVNTWSYVITQTFQYNLGSGCYTPCSFYNVGWDFSIGWSKNVGPCKLSVMDFVVDIASGTNGQAGASPSYFTCLPNMYQVVLSIAQVPSQLAFVTSSYDISNLLIQAFCGPKDFFGNCTWNLPDGTFTGTGIGFATNGFFPFIIFTNADFSADHTVASFGAGCHPGPCPTGPTPSR